MKRLLLITSAFLMLTFISSTSYAQNERPQRDRQAQGQEQRMSFADRQAKQLESMKKALALSEEQTTKITAINKKYDEKFTTLREGASSAEARKELRTEMRKIMDQYNGEVKAVLNDDQKVKYDKMLEARSQRQNGERSGQRGGRGSGARGNGGGQRGNR